jgi:hypothetical protein
MRKSIIKLIYNEKIKIDNYSFDLRNTDRRSNYNGYYNSKVDYTLKLTTCNLNDFTFLVEKFKRRIHKVDLDILLVYDNITSKMVKCLDVSLTEDNIDKLELTFYIRALYTLYDPEEATGFIRELQIKRLLDD